MSEFYSHCMQCPRQCGADRTAGRAGFCRESAMIRVAVACLHFGEEPPITAQHGSGTIFVTGCNLRCAFCQNYQISQNGMGKEIVSAEFAALCLRLQDAGAENINIVTGSHAIPAIAAALESAVTQGLSVPVCWNSSAYESVEMLERLDGLVSIWLPDLKTLNPLISDSVFKARDYPSVAKKAIRWMLSHSEKKLVTLPGDGQKEKMLSGVIIRHLVLPGRIDDTRLVLDWLKAHAEGTLKDGEDACISLMSQYTPVPFDDAQCRSAGRSDEELAGRNEALESFQNRLLTEKEFAGMRSLISAYNFSHLFYQELDASTEWLPDFTRVQPFSNELSKTVWHWTEPHRN